MHKYCLSFTVEQMEMVEMFSSLLFLLCVGAKHRTEYLWTAYRVCTVFYQMALCGNKYGQRRR